MSVIEILKVIVFGIVEGFTECLPISSTGHMILIDEIIKLDVKPDFKDVFMTVIQFGAIMAVVVLYFRKLNPLDPRKKAEQKQATWILWGKIVLATIPAAILGFLLDDWIDEHMYNAFVVSIMLIVYGILFIVVENINKYKAPQVVRIGKLSYMDAFYIGLFQVLALIPGTSRSGATILGAMILGCARPVAAEFSFYLAIPVICGASLLRVVKYGAAFTGTEIIYMTIGCAVAFLVALYTVRFFMNWIKKNNFKLFGFYRIILGVIVLIWFGISKLLA